MKIYKISADFQMIPQNPSGQTNSNISLQNMQNAQSAIVQIDGIIEAAEQVNTSIDKLQEALGVDDIGLKQDISDKISAALTANSAVNLLMKMNLLPGIEDLFNAGKYDLIKTKITNDMQSIQTQSNQESQQGVNPQGQ